VVIIDKPDAPQSTLIVGTMGPSRPDSDYVACNIVHALVGGLFTSRLNMNLREAHAYTYGAHTALYPERTLGIYLASADVETSATDSALYEMVKELQAIGHEQPLTEAELKQGKDYIRKVIPQEFSDFNGLAKKMRLIYANGLPADEWQTYLKRLDAVDADKVKHVAAEHLCTDNLLIVVVGDRQKIEAGIRNLNFGEITFMSAEDLY
jgi:zinc protease